MGHVLLFILPLHSDMFLTIFTMRFHKIQSHSLANVFLQLGLLSLTVLNGISLSNTLTLKISGLYFVVLGPFTANWCYK